MKGPFLGCLVNLRTDYEVFLLCISIRRLRRLLDGLGGVGASRYAPSALLDERSSKYAALLNERSSNDAGPPND